MNDIIEKNIAETGTTKLNSNVIFKSSFFNKMISSVLLKNSAISALNQAIISGANFFVALILVRNVAKGEYGIYSFAFAVLMFIVSVQNALITTPMSILLVAKKDEKKNIYTSSLLLGQILTVISISIITIAAVYFTAGNSLFNDTKTATVAAVAFAIIGVLLREFFRAYAYADEKPVKALILDSKYIAAYILFILIAYYFEFVRTPLVFLLMGIAALISPAISSLGLSFKATLKSIKSSYSENWEFGRWSLLGVMITHIQTYSYIYLLSLLIGSTAVADASASKLLLMPIVLFQAGWGNVVRPYGSRLREENKMEKFFSQQLKLGIAASLLIILYSFIVYSFSGLLSEYIFTEKYREALNYVVLWGVVFAINFFRINASNGLQVLKDFKHITIYNFYSMLITIVLSYFLIIKYEVVGSLIAFAVGELVLALILWYKFNKTVKELI